VACTNIKQKVKDRHALFLPGPAKKRPPFFYFFGKQRAPANAFYGKKKSCGGGTHTGSRSLPHGHAANPTESPPLILARGRTSAAQLARRVRIVDCHQTDQLRAVSPADKCKRFTWCFSSEFPPDFVYNTRNKCERLTGN
jgi:hypothetical protein